MEKSLHRSQALLEERLDLWELTFHADHFGIINDRTRREHMIQGVEVLIIDRITISDEQILNFKPIRHFLQGQGHQSSSSLVFVRPSIRSHATDHAFPTVGGCARNYLENRGDPPVFRPALVADRKSVVKGMSVAARVDLGGHRVIKKKKS